jgi:hypothetical protein
MLTSEVGGHQYATQIMIATLIIIHFIIDCLEKCFMYFYLHGSARSAPYLNMNGLTPSHVRTQLHPTVSPKSCSPCQLALNYKGEVVQPPNSVVQPQL